VLIASLLIKAVLMSGMGIEDRRERERAERRRLILATARTLAEAEGWDAVTTRRLSTEIEYSQPVLYKHFAGLDHIAEALAIDGFGELAALLHAARAGAGSAGDPLTPVAHAYLDFAEANAALYEAMFTRATKLRFGDDSPPALAAAFSEMRATIADVIGPDGDADTLTEVFWAALHGLTALTGGGRLRPDHATERVQLLVARFLGRPG
jgi:AcrR family transcriptional regulator